MGKTDNEKLLACLPSLGPIITLVSIKFSQICKRKRISQPHKRGSELLKEILPVFKATAPPSPILPSVRAPSWNDGPNPMLDSSPILEVDSNPRVRELDAESPGPQILEIETVVHTSITDLLENALELEAQMPIAELEGSTLL